MIYYHKVVMVLVHNYVNKIKRNSVRKSISIDGIRKFVRAFNKGLNTAKNISSEILEKTRNRNRFKQTLTSKDNEYFRRRQENIKKNNVKMN